VLVYDPDVEMYAVEVPELPGCFTQGHTVEEALERVREAVSGHVASLVAAGEEVPSESVPVIVSSVEVDSTCAPAASR
jgi:predicted RNase H-like HicB family nuclease